MIDDNTEQDSASVSPEDWAARITQSVKERTKWYTRCKNIKKIFSDRRDGSPLSQDSRKFNILWSNTQTIAPVLFSRLPEPVVLPREFVKQNPDAEMASVALKRSIESMIKADGFDAAVKKIVLDYLLTSQGIGWVTYEPEFGQYEGIEIKISDSVKFNFVNYKDFLTNKARTWDEVTWCARKLELGKSACQKYFPDLWPRIVYDDNGKATVWEVWDKESGEQVFVAPDQIHKILKRGPVPIDFDGFFPCPEAILSNTDNESTIPVPDYILYQDQADDLNKYTAAISRIGDALKVRGTYLASNEALSRLFDENQDNILVPTNTPMDQNPFQFVPLDIFAQAAAQISLLKNQCKQDIYEITGISDVVRGASNPNETATAQNIKNQWGGLRIRDRQKSVQTFIRDAIRLMAEVIAEHFDPEFINEMSGVQLNDGALKILRDGALRNFIIDVETDSTIEPDAQQEKQDRAEFLQAMASYLDTATKISAQAPQLTPMLAKMVEFGLRAFPVGTEMQSRISQSLEQLVQAKMQQLQQPPPPSPEMEKIKIDQFNAQTNRMKATADAYLKTQELNSGLTRDAMAAMPLQPQLQEEQQYVV